MMSILVAMAAIAFTLGIGGQAEVWSVTDPTVGFEHVPHTVVVEQPAQCVSSPIVWVDGSPKLPGFESLTYTGGLEPGQIRMSMVGHYVNIAVGYPGQVDVPSSEDMVLWSIDATGLDEVTVCLP